MKLIVFLLFPAIVFASPVVVITRDTAAQVDYFVAKSEEVRARLLGKIRGRGGVRRLVSPDGKMSVVCLTSIDGLEDVAKQPYITITSYEEIFGYWRQVEIDGVLRFGPDIEIVEPEHTIPVIIGYEDDLSRPIPVMEAVYEDWERVFLDMDGNEVRIAERRLVGYRETGEFDGYYSKEIYGTRLVLEYRYSTPNPTMELVPPVVAMRVLYDRVYPQTTQIHQGENGSYEYTPPPLMSIPAGTDISHLNLP